MKKTANPTLTAEQRAAAQPVAAYAHRESGRTACLHLEGEAYTITGLHCGPAPESTEPAAPKGLTAKTK